jgi:hypothetical protein
MSFKMKFTHRPKEIQVAKKSTKKNEMLSKTFR